MQLGEQLLEYAESVRELESLQWVTADLRRKLLHSECASKTALREKTHQISLLKDKLEEFTNTSDLLSKAKAERRDTEDCMQDLKIQLEECLCRERDLEGKLVIQISFQYHKIKF